MRIREFVEKVSVRFDSKLKTPAQIAAFEEDCKDHLKNYEGEVLGFAFHEILCQNKSRTHPTVAQVKKFCNEKATTEHAKKHEHNPEAEQWHKNKQLVSDIKETDLFERCAANMIGNDALVFIGKNNRLPNDEDLRRLYSERQVFLKDMDAMKNDHDISELRLAIYKMGQSLEEKNRAYFNQFKAAA